jgi:putative transposase
MQIYYLDPMPRIARICGINHPHHITQRGNNRETVFFDDEDRRFYLNTLSRYIDEWDIEIWAYCLMTNHVHILAVPRKEESLAKGMGSTNLVYTQYINRRYGRSGRLWQNRFFSTVIERESYLWAVARYIERNPVRANIVKKAEDYPWSSAKAHVVKAKDEVLSGESWLGENEFSAYRDSLRKEDKKLNDFIRKATSTGRPLGHGEFVKSIGKMIGRDIISKGVGRPNKSKNNQRK